MVSKPKGKSIIGISGETNVSNMSFAQNDEQCVICFDDFILKQYYSEYNYNNSEPGTPFTLQNIQSDIIDNDQIDYNDIPYIPESPIRSAIESQHCLKIKDPKIMN